jgi:hypothetical protein
MYCPKCGTQTNDDQKFCRGCGFNLLPVSLMLTGQPAEAIPEKVTEVSRWRGLRSRGFFLLWLGIIFIVVIGVAGEFIASLDHSLGQFLDKVAELGCLPLIVGACLMAYSRLLQKNGARGDAHPGQKSIKPTSPSILEKPAVTSPVGLPSVTEHTTYRLK